MYTYAFLLSGIPSLDLPEGIMGALKIVSVEQVSALVEPELAVEVLQASDELLVQAVLAHDGIIRDVFEQTAVLPLRFGTYFVSRQAVVEHLAAHQAEYLLKLAALQEKAEYLLKLIPRVLPEPAIAPDLKGKDYFLAKKHHYQAQAEWQQQQQQELDRLIQMLTQPYPDLVRGEASEGLERFYILCNRQTEPLLYDSLKNWQQQCAHWELSLSDRLPPYHFV